MNPEEYSQHLRTTRSRSQTEVQGLSNVPSLIALSCNSRVVGHGGGAHPATARSPQP